MAARWMLACGVLAAYLAGTKPAASAADHFLTIGGGYAPSGNQVSLEKNVLFFQQLLGEIYRSGAPHDILFSDGDSPQRDLQFADPTVGVPRANRLVARVFDKENDLNMRFRTHAVPGIRGASTPENLDRWFHEVGEHLPAGDRLIVYLTGHGGKGSKEQNPHFFMWRRRQVPVNEFVARLDKLNPGVHVVLVMVQCYSGGFANCIFNEGNPEKGVTAADRCGFYATVQNRQAAGCTPDIDEENYQEYSSSFWAAMCGHSRMGESIKPLDCDADGRISFAEAHAYTVLTSNTIDIPVKTSDAFLRTYSKTKADDQPDLLTAEAPFETLEGLATPVERAVLEGLSQTLELTGSERTQAARELAAKLEKEREEIQRENKRINGRYHKARGAVAESLKLRWPELENPWNPQAAEELQREAPEIVAAIEGHDRYSDLAQLHDELESRATRALDLERRWAKCQRFLRFAENVALAANLSKLAAQEIQDRYHVLLDSESGTLCAECRMRNDE